MLTKPEPVQNEMETVVLEELVPADHLLRKIRKVIDFSFIYEKTKNLYCPNNGRPAIDPIKLFKILFIGYLFGIRSERQIIQEIQVNVAYRWFLGYNLTDKIPDASTISQNRRRRFNDTDIAQEIFDEIVRQAMKHNLADGKTLYTDSTHLKANANKNKFVKEEREVCTKPYLDELDKAIEEDRERHGKNPLKAKKKHLN
jgi:transposase